MGTLRDFTRMIVSQQAGRQSLERVVEPRTITDAADHVSQYDSVMTTKLVIAYAVGIEAVHRARPDAEQTRAIDIACGPGHFTLCLARYLRCQSILGVDLSSPMVDIAAANATQQGLDDRASFRVGDATELGKLTASDCDLTTFTDAAHHMPDLKTVGRVLSEMEQATKPTGLIMAMDLVRLRTAALTERYVNTLGHDYVERGLPSFFKDFRNSMYAAWTADELFEAIPRDTNRHWCQIVPRGLPTIQFILGLPVGRKKPFVRTGFPWQPEDCPVPKEMISEWKMLRMSLRLGRRRWISPATSD